MADRENKIQRILSRWRRGGQDRSLPLYQNPTRMIKRFQIWLTDLQFPFNQNFVTKSNLEKRKTDMTEHKGKYGNKFVPLRSSTPQQTIAHLYRFQWQICLNALLLESVRVVLVPFEIITLLVLIFGRRGKCERKRKRWR